MDNNYRFEQISDNIFVCVSNEHIFGTDAFLLSYFCEAKRNDIVCELGTGCGIISQILCTKNAPKKIYAVDIQENAIEQLKKGIEKSGLSENIVPVLADLKQITCKNGLKREIILDENGFDLVICNPPYKKAKSGIVNPDDSKAIARHEIMCDINDVCACASRLLKYGGRLCLCQRPERLADVICAMRNNDIEPKKLRFVSKDKESEAWLFLIEGRKGGAPFLNVMPGLFVSEINQENLSSRLYGAGGSI